MSSETVELKREMQDDYNYKEAIKTLRTNIQFCGRSIRAVLFTSSLPDEGKSDCSGRVPGPDRQKDHTD